MTVHTAAADRHNAGGGYSIIGGGVFVEEGGGRYWGKKSEDESFPQICGTEAKSQQIVAQGYSHAYNTTFLI